MVRRWRLTVFIVALLACLSGPNVTNYDSYLAVPVAWSALRHGDLDLDEYAAPAIVGHHGYVGVDGHRHDFYPWPVAMLAVPTLAVTAVGAELGLWPSVDQLIRDNTMDLLQLVTASVICALATMVMAMVAFERFDGRVSPRTAAATALLFLLATTMWSTASRALWQHGPAALFVVLALLDGQRLLQCPPRRPAPPGHPPSWRAWVRLGLWLALATMMRPTAAIAGAVLAAAVLWGVTTAQRSGGTDRDTPTVTGRGMGLGMGSAYAARRLGRGPMLAACGAAVVLLPFFMVNVAVFGAVLPTSYSASRLALHDRYVEALAANLISPARGVLVSVPLLGAAIVAALTALIAARRNQGRRDPLRIACLAGVGLHWLVISAGSFGWWAGHSYGARFFTEATPLMAYLGLDLLDRVGRPGVWRVVVGTLAAAGIAVQLPGVYLRSTQCWNGDPTDIDADPGRIWSWSAPPFLHAARQVADGLPLRQVVLGPCPPAGSTQPDTS